MNAESSTLEETKGIHETANNRSRTTTEEEEEEEKEKEEEEEKEEKERDIHKRTNSSTNERLLFPMKEQTIAGHRRRRCIKDA